jgi:hypothetical protein
MNKNWKAMARRVKLSVQCWWLDHQVDRLSRRIAATGQRGRVHS